MLVLENRVIDLWWHNHDFRCRQPWTRLQCGIRDISLRHSLHSIVPCLEMNCLDSQKMAVIPQRQMLMLPDGMWLRWCVGLDLFEYVRVWGFYLFSIAIFRRCFDGFVILESLWSLLILPGCYWTVWVAWAFPFLWYLSSFNHDVLGMTHKSVHTYPIFTAFTVDPFCYRCVFWFIYSDTDLEFGTEMFSLCLLWSLLCPVVLDWHKLWHRFYILVRVCSMYFGIVNCAVIITIIIATIIIEYSNGWCWCLAL